MTTLVGMKRIVKLQPLKELLPMLVTEVGIKASFSRLSPVTIKNALHNQSASANNENTVESSAAYRCNSPIKKKK